MKKVLPFLFFISICNGVFSQSDENSKFRVGLGTLYTSEIESTGISVKGIYAIDEKWELSLGYAHVFENIGLSWDVIDLDGHFVFYDNDKKFNAYALAGLALTFWKREAILIPNRTTTGNYFGLNLGAGCNFKLSDHFVLTPELRGTLFDLSYTRIGLIVQYAI